MKSHVTLILVALFPLFSFSQKLEHAVGLNFNFLHNKYYGGIDYKLLRNSNTYNTNLLWSFQLNYGILGIKEYSISDENVDTTGGGILVSNGLGGPIYVGPSLPGYYANYQKVKVRGLNFSVVRDFQCYNFIYLGIGAGYAMGKDIGYMTHRNPRTNEVKKDFYPNVIHSISVLTKPSIFFDVSKLVSVNIAAHFYFYYPISNDQTHALLPIIGVEQDLSFSLVYKL